VQRLTIEIRAPMISKSLQLTVGPESWLLGNLSQRVLRNDSWNLFNQRERYKMYSVLEVFLDPRPLAH